MCDGGGGLQGEVQRCDVGADPQYIQRDREQLLDGISFRFRAHACI